MFTRSITTVGFVAVCLTASVVFGQCACGVPTTSYYAPAVSSYMTAYAPVTTNYAPEYYTSYYTPTTAYYTPEVRVAYYAPTTTYYAPQPYVSYYTPTSAYYASTPTPYVSYYAPVVRPAVPNAMVGASIYGTQKVYVWGEPVRNTLRAITP